VDALPLDRAAPPVAALEALLDTFAPLTPPPLCPEILAFQARSLVEIWEAAERLAEAAVPAPFWAYAWPAGQAIARVLLDQPHLVAGGRVLDIGAGGGVASLAALRAGAAEVVVNDTDPWALAIAALAAARQGFTLASLPGDLTAAPDRVAGFDLVLCADLAYERSRAPAQRALLTRLRAGGARVLIADAERPYFQPDGLRPLARFTVPVARDLEGVDHRIARVYELP
jgi:predicted nicotinamide N-methyase